MVRGFARIKAMNKRKTRGGQRVWLACISLFALTACQSFQPTTGGTGGFDNASFMALWNTYNHCKEESDLSAMQEDVRHLQRASTSIPLNGFLLPLPNSVKRYVAPPPSRLAVDPKAMAAACGLYTGQLALTLGNTEVATRMFETVVRTNSQPEYAYYASQAMAGLREIEFGLQAANPEGRVLRTSSAGNGLHRPTPTPPSSH
jgi:hypothetical protein